MKEYRQTITVTVELERPMWVASVFADRLDMTLVCEYKVEPRNYAPSDTSQEVNMEITDATVEFSKDGNPVITKDIEPYVSKDWDDVVRLYRRTAGGSLYDFLIDQLDTSGF